MTTLRDRLASHVAPKDAAFARQSVADLEAGNPDRSARKAMAELTVKHGNYTPEGMQVWRDYLAGLEA